MKKQLVQNITQLFTKNVPMNAIVRGVPAKVVGEVPERERI